MESKVDITACKALCTRVLLKKPKEIIDRCTACCDITEVMLKIRQDISEL